ncbi:hypothetical protein [Treponema sp.]|uniref:tetratricopeptide repeat protein n=1 Tax=Treponema sp. TaxID=166 RepID=UPI0025EE501A|nr:hypothetical protein [Treponema sp.]MBR4323092.1 sel1 repeat family protein [Treponema sp.]
MPKCKICGSRLSEEVSKCPMCGAVYNKTTSKPVVNNTPVVKQTPVIQNNKEVYSEVETEEDEELTSTELISYGNYLLNNNPEPSQQREAFMCFQQALEMGDSEAHFPLGLCYMNGKGTEEDSEMAYHHFYEAHYSDDYDGTAMLGLCCFFGIGTEQNKAKGIEYIKLAKSNESEWGKYFLKQIKKEEKKSRKEQEILRQQEEESDALESMAFGFGSFLGAALMETLFGNKD